MIFTREDYRNIQNWLEEHSIKDTQFPQAQNVKPDSIFVITMNGQNFKIDVQTFLNLGISQTELDNIQVHNLNVDRLVIDSGDIVLSDKNRDLGAILERLYTLIYRVQEDLSTKQDTLISGVNIKTINRKSILGSGNITIKGEGGSGTYDYEELDNKPQINSIELVGNKSLNTLGIASVEQLSAKQNIIQDLSTIRYNATLATTALQPADIIDMATKTWVNSQGYLTSFTESDPIFSSSVASTITSTNISNWNNKQDAIPNLNTIISNASNGATAYSWGNHATAGYASVVSPELTGVPTAPTNTSASDDSTQIATDAFVQNAINAHSGIDKVGTVTSVGISVPTGLSVSTSPITTEGTIQISYATGYSIPLISKQNSWDDAVLDSHTHSNKNVLDSITSALIEEWNTKQDALVSGTNIKTINNQSILGSGNIDIQSGGTSDYEELTNKPQINSIELVGNVSLSTLGIASITQLNTKQNTIQDLENIRTNASLGATAVQPSAISDMATQTWVNNQGYLTEHQSLSAYSTTTQMNAAISSAVAPKANTADLSSVAFSGSYSDLEDIPDIPQEVTESTVASWGFTKNTGTITEVIMNGVSKGTSGVINLGTVLTAHQDISGKQDVITDLDTIREGATLGNTAYQKPSSGVPYSDLNSSVQTLLDKADTALQEEVYKGTVVSVNNNTPDAGGNVSISIPTSLSQLSQNSSYRTVSDTEKTTWNNKSNFSGSYEDLTDKPTIPSIEGLATQTYVDTQLSTKQASLVSGVNIKTINNISILGSGNISIQSGLQWTDLENTTSTSHVIDSSHLPSSITGLVSRVTTLEGSSVTGITTTGSGNAVTSVSKSGNTITFTKGSSFPVLDNGKIPMSYLPDAILGQVIYGGTLGASALATLTANAKAKLGTTASTLTLSTGSTGTGGYTKNEGIYYIASTSQTFGSISLQVGDWLLSTGIGWTKIDNTDAVTGVKGNAESSYRIGNINITPANIGKATTSALGCVQIGSGLSVDANGIVSIGSFSKSHISDFPTTWAWGSISGKPTTVSGYGITDMRSQSVGSLLGAGITDLNDPGFTSDGMNYRKFDKNALNIPVVSNNANGVINCSYGLHSTSGHYGFQLAHEAGTGRMYFRNWQAGTPQSWQTIAYASDLTSYLPLTGGSINGNLSVSGDLLAANVIGNTTRMRNQTEDGQILMLSSGGNWIQSGNSNGNEAKSLYITGAANSSIPYLTLRATSTIITGSVSVGGTLGVTGQITSGVATGTAPFSVSSTTAVTNLNADMLDGLHAGNFARDAYGFGSDGDYIYIVILLCRAYTASSSFYSRMDGTMYTMYSGSSRCDCADIHFWNASWSASAKETRAFIQNYGSYDWKIRTCTYNGAQYYCLELRRTQAVAYYFTGSMYNIDGRKIQIYNAQTGTVLNSEIWNSLADVPYVEERVSGSMHISGGILSDSYITANGNASIGGTLTVNGATTLKQFTSAGFIKTNASGVLSVDTSLNGIVNAPRIIATGYVNGTSVTYTYLEGDLTGTSTLSSGSIGARYFRLTRTGGSIVASAFMIQPSGIKANSSTITPSSSTSITAADNNYTVSILGGYGSSTTNMISNGENVTATGSNGIYFGFTSPQVSAASDKGLEYRSTASAIWNGSDAFYKIAFVIFGKLS